MYVLLGYPIQSVIALSIAPLMGGFIGYKNAHEDQDNLEQAMKGIGIGLLIDLPFLCYILYEYSAMENRWFERPDNSLEATRFGY